MVPSLTGIFTSPAVSPVASVAMAVCAAIGCTASANPTASFSRNSRRNGRPGPSAALLTKKSLRCSGSISGNKLASSEEIPMPPLYRYERGRMKKMNLKLREPCQPEPRWPSAAALGAVAVLHYALPSALSPGPDWLVPLLVLAFTTPALISHRIRAYRAAQVFGYVALCTVTVMTLASLGLLVAGLP